MSSAANEKRLTWKRSLDGCEDVGLREGVTVGEAITKLAALEERDIVEVVHGRWIDRPGIKGQVYCSECATIEKSTDSNYKSRRCPNCGAKMDGDGDG